MNEIIDTRIQDPEKAHTLALAGDSLRSEAAQERKKANAIKLAKLAYDSAPEERDRTEILNKIFSEVGINDIFQRPDIVRDDSFDADFLEVDQLDIDLQRDKQINGFFESSTRHESRAQDLDDLAERKESWAELIYENPAVEHYKIRYPELYFDDEWGLERQVDNAQEYYSRHLKDMTRYVGVLKDGRYIPGGLMAHLFEHIQPEEEREGFEPNPELLDLLQNDGTTVAQLREFLLRQEYLSLEAERVRAEELSRMLSDVKNRLISSIGVSEG